MSAIPNHPLDIRAITPRSRHHQANGLMMSCRLIQRVEHRPANTAEPQSNAVNAAR